MTDYHTYEWQAATQSHGTARHISRAQAEQRAGRGGYLGDDTLEELQAMAREDGLHTGDAEVWMLP